MEFQRGRKTIKDDTCPGCPVRAITTENMSTKITHSKIHLGIGSSEVDLILHRCLGTGLTNSVPAGYQNSNMSKREVGWNGPRLGWENSRMDSENLHGESSLGIKYVFINLTPRQSSSHPFPCFQVTPL